MVFHRDPLGIATFIGVHILLLFGDLVGVYVVIEYGRHEGTWRTIAALVLHVLYILAVTSHLRASFSNPGYVPQSGIKIDFSSDLEHKDRKKRKKEPPPLDEWTVCTKCETYRPPRSHHCRICGRCVRRMDHHCPWINNCVGELNYKYFFLFIAYADILCTYGLGLIIWDWITNWHTDQGTLDRTLTIIAFFEAVIFGVFVGGMLLAQVLSVLCNRSAIEIRRYGRPLGMPATPKLALIAGVCGRGPKILWFFPCAKAHIPDPIPPSDKFHDINQFV